MNKIIDILYSKNNISEEGLHSILLSDDTNYLFEMANKKRIENFNNRVILRGLIEFSNYCSNNCYYCGLQCSNRNIKRYALTKEEILQCCQKGYDEGLHSFVLQSGESTYYSVKEFSEILKDIKREFKDIVITLSIGEKSYDEYLTYYKSGAERFLLRFETSDSSHYEYLHPKEMSLKNRMTCLKNLKDIGYQTGTGFMVGSPNQTVENLVKDVLFLKELQPHMVGIGPFIPQQDTIFANEKAGSVDLVLKLIAIIRLLLPNTLIPATTALRTLNPNSLEKALNVGANVMMPNLSPDFAKENYKIYDEKETKSDISNLVAFLKSIGYTANLSRGDHPDFIS